MSDNEITLHGNFWPTLWYINLGGNVHFDLTVTFSGTPPESYDYQVFLRDYEGNTVKTWSGTKNTEGQPETQVRVAWDGRNSGEKIPYKPMRFYAEVTDNVNLLSAEGGFCSGVHPQPGPNPVPEPPSDPEPPVNPTEPPEIPSPPYPPNPPATPVDPPGPGEDDVHMFGGALTAHMVDLSIPDLGIPITVERYYHSLGTTMQRYSSKFATCLFNFEEQIGYDETDNSFTVIFPNRSICRFVKQGSSYIPSGENNYNTLEDGPEGTRILTFKNGWKHYFDGAGRLIKVQNRTGQSITCDWPENQMECISRITGPSGRYLEFNYIGEDLNNSEIIITDWTGRTLRYQVTDGCISQKTDPEENKFAYLENGETFTALQSITPPNGTILTNEGGVGSPLGVHVMKQTPGVGAEYNYQYDWDNCRTTVIRGDRKWEYHFDKTTGLLKRAIDPMNYERAWTRDGNGNVTGYTDAAGRTSTYTWDDRGNMTSATDFLGNTTTCEYNSCGQMTKRTSPGDLITEWEYDETTGNLIRMTDPQEREATFEYYANGLLKKSTDILGRISEYEYDHYGNVTKTGNGSTTTVQYEYDLVGNTVKENSNGNITRYEYNLNNDKIKRTDSSGDITVYEYDGNRNVVGTAFPDGTRITSKFNAMNDLTSSSRLNGSTTSYKYDQFRQLTEISDPEGTIAKYEYDRLGRKTKETDKSGRVTEYSYESLSKDSVTDNNGKTTTREYDELGRLFRIIYNDGSYHQYTYDQYRMTITQPGERYGEIRYGGNGYGSKSYGSENYGGSGTKYGFDPGNKIEYVYDEETGRLKYVLYPRSKTVSYQYDEKGRTAGITDIRGYRTEYQYDEANRMTKAVYRGNEILYTYDSQNRLSTATLPNGIVKTMTYENETGDTIKQIKYEKGTDVLYQVDLEFENDMIKSKTVSRFSYPPKTYRYVSDGDSRIVGVYLNGKAESIYNYDSNGNLIQKRDGDNKTTDFHYDSSNQLITAGEESYRYDNNGNVSEKQIVSRNNPSQYIYDNENHLAMTVTPEGYSPPFDGIPDVDPQGLYTFRYRYYPDGERSKKISPSGRELRFYYNNGSLLNEEGWFARTPFAKDGYRIPSGNEEDRVTHIVSWIYGVETSPIGIDTTPTHAGANEKCINYYLTDENNSIIALSDGFGGLVKVYEYDENGNRIDVSSDSAISNPHTGYNPLGFTGKHLDATEDRKLSNSNNSKTITEKFKKLLQKFTEDEEKKWKKENPGNEYICYHQAYLLSSKYFVLYALKEGFFVRPTVVVFEKEYLYGHYGVYMEVTDMKTGAEFYAFTDVNRPRWSWRTYEADTDWDALVDSKMWGAKVYGDNRDKAAGSATGRYFTPDGKSHTFKEWVDSKSMGAK